MKKLIGIAATLYLILFIHLNVAAQFSNLEALLTEGYTIPEMENVMKQVTYKNYKKWMKGKNYKYKEEMHNGFTQVFDKNDIVTIVLYFSPDDHELKHVIFFSSPQKFYMAEAELEKEGYKKIKVEKEKNDSGIMDDLITWKKDGNPYVFISSHKEYFVQIKITEENDKKARAEKIKKAEKLEIRDSRPDRIFYSYAYDSICKFGFSMGTINTRSLGVYFTARVNPEVFTSGAANGTVDNKGIVTGGQFTSWGNDWRFNNVIRTGIAEGMIGLTKKIIYPLWVYTGVGVSYNQSFWEMDIHDNNGDYFATDWVKNTDEAKFNPVVESGLIVDFNGFNIRGGLKTHDFKEITLTLGVGFSLVR